MYDLDFSTVDDLLGRWRISDCDPYWMVRKACLLLEVHRIAEAVDAFQQALTNIRKTPSERDGVGGLSRQGWALWMAWALESRYYTEKVPNRPDTRPFLRRWRELAPSKCDALAEKQEYVKDVRRSDDSQEAPAFDVGRRQRPGYRISNEGYYRWLHARRAVRLCEVAALPIADSSYGAATDVSKSAGDALSSTEPELATRLLLRTLNFDGDVVLKRVLSRPRVANLDSDSCKTLTDIAERIMDHAVVELRDRQEKRGSWVERMRVAMEVMSRLVVRLEPGRVENVFERSLKYYRDEETLDHLWLMEPIRNLLCRSWETLPDRDRTERILDILELPIVGLNGFKQSWTGHYEPIYLVSDSPSGPERTAGNEARWEVLMGTLIRGLNEDGEPRKRASVRVAYLALQDRLTEAEKDAVLASMWSKEFTRTDDLPSGTLLHDWVFFVLPEPELGMAENRFRGKWLSSGSKFGEETSDVNNVLWKIGSTISGLRRHGRKLNLGKDEREHVTTVIDRWAKSPLPGHLFMRMPMQGQTKLPIRRAIGGLREILLEVELPEDVAVALCERIEKLKDAEIYGLSLTAGLSRVLPKQFDSQVLDMRMALCSENADLVEDAASGLLFWLKAANNSDREIPSPPDDLLREISVLIATRRRGSLVEAMQVARWVFEHGRQTQRDRIAELVLHGLGYLVEDLKYSRASDDSRDDDTPTLRWRCVQLAIAMSKNGFGEEWAVKRWLSVMDIDPLPEVRNAMGPTFADNPEAGHDENDENGI